ncbi:MAG: carbohydrate kinase family protein [Defluviitaleaceae bacterium]|nr:carbohydrate kinase family protein [Defluviitaleaceae bacterium]
MDIVGIGTPCIDMISVLDKLPSPNKGSGVKDFSRQGGGVVATALAAAAQLGASVSYIGVTGTCVHGQAIREDFLYNSVDISHSVIDEGAYSHFAYVLSDLETEGRSIVYRKGSTRELNIEDIDRKFITSTNYLHLERCDEPSATAAKWMREASKKVVYDASSYSKEIEDFLPNIDVFIASEFYYDECFQSRGDYEENCMAIAAQGPGVVVFTLGEKGCVGYSKEDGYFEVEGCAVPVVDTVGAGDVFHGAFLFGLSKGMPIKDIAKFSCAVSAIKIGAIGGRAGIPSYNTTIKFMETGIIDRTETEERILYYQNKWLFGQP